MKQISSLGNLSSNSRDPFDNRIQWPNKPNLKRYTHKPRNIDKICWAHRPFLNESCRPTAAVVSLHSNNRDECSLYIYLFWFMTGNFDGISTDSANGLDGLRCRDSILDNLDLIVDYYSVNREHWRRWSLSQLLKNWIDETCKWKKDGKKNVRIVRERGWPEFRIIEMEMNK